MTVSTEYNGAVTFAGGTAVLAFTFPHKVFNDDDLIVKIITGASEALLTLGVGYTVTGYGPSSNSAVVNLTSAVAGGSTLSIKRATPLTQESDFINSNRFDAEAFESALDKLTIIDQEQQDSLDDYAADITALKAKDVQLQTDLDALEVAQAADRADINARTAAPSPLTVLSYGNSGSPQLLALSQLLTGISNFTKRASIDGPRANFDAFAPGTTWLDDSADPMSFYQRSGGAGSWLGPFKWSWTDNQVRDLFPFNVKRYGAVGDGIALEDAALAATLAAAPDNSIIIMPPGTYKLGAAGWNIVSRNNLRIVGFGAKIKLSAVSSLTVTGFGATSIKFSGCSRSGIEGVEIDGSSLASNLIGFSGCTDCFAERNTLYSGGLNAQIVSVAGVRTRINKNLVYSAVGTARGIWAGNVNATDMETDIEVIGNISRNNPASGIVVASNGGRVAQNHSRSNAGSGIVIPGANGFATSSVAVTGNYCIGNTFHGIQSDVTYNTDADLSLAIEVSGNVCSGNASTGIYVINSRFWNITGNVCNDNVFAGIAIDDRTKDVTVSGNTCCDTRSGVSRTQQLGIRCTVTAIPNAGVNIIGNTCNNNTTDGIRVFSTASGITLSKGSCVGNVCNDNSSRGIFFTEVTAGDVSGWIFSGNSCQGNTTQDIRLSARNIFVGDNSYATQLNLDVFDLDALSATPNVGGRKMWRAANAGATSITAFNGGVDGQIIIIRASNANTTIVHSVSLVCKGSVNVNIPSGGVISFLRAGGIWIEASRSF